MPWTLPDGLVSGVLRSPCASIQITPPGCPAAAAMPESVPIATEWSPPSTSGVAPADDDLGDGRRQPRARVEDLVEVARALVADRERLGLVGDDVAAVAGDDADRSQALLEARVADRRRAHVDAAPALSEVERRADDGDGPGARHGRAAYCPARLPALRAPRHDGEGRTRTGDTPVFSRVLYQLSYLAAGISVATPAGHALR